MKYVIAIFIFCLVLFLYLHIQYHLKTSNDLEVYTIEHPSKEKLEEICDLRQPVIFDFYNERLIQSCNLAVLDDSYGAFDIKLRNVTDIDEHSETYLPFLLKEAIKLFQTDKEKKFITENNGEFLTETSLVKNFKYNDGFLRPPMVSKCEYDLWSGSAGCTTPLRYYLNYRNFIYLTEGHITLKLVPPHSSKYLNVIKDYENGEFRSPINPWDVQQRYKGEFDKVKTLDIPMQPGMIIYIPAYWWYSMRYDKMSTVCSFQYRTYMNTLAILPDLLIGLLQRQNIKHQVVASIGAEGKSDPPTPIIPHSDTVPKKTAAPPPATHVKQNRQEYASPIPVPNISGSGALAGHTASLAPSPVLAAAE